MKANEAQMANMPPEAKKMMEKTTAQLKETVVKRCKADKWSDAAIKCLTAAKKAEDFDKCEGTLTQEQRDNFEKDMKAAMGMPAEPSATPAASGAAAPASSAQAEAPPAEAPPEHPERAVTAAPAISDGPTGIAECDRFVAALESYVACERIPRELRDAARPGLISVVASASRFRDPAARADERKIMAELCDKNDAAIRDSLSRKGCP